MLPPFTGQFNHAAGLKFYERKLDELKSLMNTQSPEQARQIYEQALASAPDDVFLRLNFVAFMETEGYLAQAIAGARRCCELLPWVPDIHYHTATLLVQGGNPGDAVQYLARALALRSDYVEAMNEMGEILANQRQTLQAVDWFKRAIRSDPHRADTYINLGFLLQNQGDTAAALGNYQNAAVLEPGGPADYFYQANIAASAYRWGDVIEYLTRAVGARPQFWQARYQLGIQLAAKGESEAAQKQFLEVIHNRPDFVPAHLDRGTALEAEGKTNEALTEFRAVLQLDPSNDSARQQIQLIETSLPKGRPG
jgi:tetratricopeptide (TPR) repeat protein